jgi:hypothetical protein
VNNTAGCRLVCIYFAFATSRFAECRRNRQVKLQQLPTLNMSKQFKDTAPTGISRNSIKNGQLCLLALNVARHIAAQRV